MRYRFSFTACPAVRPGLSFPYPRKRKVFRCFLVVFPFPQTVHVTHWAPMLRMWWGMCLELCVSVWLLLPVSREAATKLKHIIRDTRSEDHTSELQSRFDLVCRLLLEKKT